MRRALALALTWVSCAGGGAFGQAVEGTYALRTREGEDVAQLEIDRAATGKLRLTRDAETVWIAEDAVQAGRMIYALYRSQGQSGLAGAVDGGVGVKVGEQLLGVYRFSPDLRTVEERVTRQDGDERLLAHTRGQRVVAGQMPVLRGARAPRGRAPAPPVDVGAVVTRFQDHLRGADVMRDLAALRQRDVALELTVTRLGTASVDEAHTLMTGSSRTRLVRQQVDSSAALELFRLGALRNPPAQAKGVRGLSSLLEQEIVPQRFGRAYLLLGQGRTPSTRFSEPDQVETWVLLAETRQGEMLAVRAEWQTPARASE